MYFVFLCFVTLTRFPALIHRRTPTYLIGVHHRSVSHCGTLPHSDASLLTTTLYSYTVYTLTNTQSCDAHTLQNANHHNNIRSGANKLGDFTYDITREYWGNIEMVGESISVSGKMHGSSYNGSDAYLGEMSMNESELGYFTMIDAVASDDGVKGEKKYL